jgi:hypothetical protein
MPSLDNSSAKRELAFGVDTLNLATVSGDELINIPYSYKVG